MTTEACDAFNSPYTGIAQRLNQHYAQIPQVTKFRQAVESVPNFGIHVLPVTASDVLKAAEISQTSERLGNDALVVAVMLQHGPAVGQLLAAEARAAGAAADSQRVADHTASSVGRPPQSPAVRRGIDRHSATQ